MDDTNKMLKRFNYPTKLECMNPILFHSFNIIECTRKTICISYNKMLMYNEVELVEKRIDWRKTLF